MVVRSKIFYNANDVDDGNDDDDNDDLNLKTNTTTIAKATAAKSMRVRFFYIKTFNFKVARNMIAMFKNRSYVQLTELE